MGTQFWWIFDALVIIVAAAFIYSNAKRGMTKVLVMSLGYLVVSVVASFLSAAIAPTLYEVMAKESVITSIQDVNRLTDFSRIFSDAINMKQYGTNMNKAEVHFVLENSIDQNFDMMLYHKINEKCEYEVDTFEAFHENLEEAFLIEYGAKLEEYLPVYVRRSFEAAYAEDPDLMYRMIRMFYQESHTATEIAEYIEEQFAREPSEEVYRIFVFLAIFSLIMVFVAFIASMLEYRLVFNVTRVKDHVLGGLLGIIEACVMLVLLTQVIQLIVMLGGGSLLCFNEETIEASYLFRPLYTSLNRLL